MKLYFVRHGESTANILRVFSNHALDHPLTPLGVAQARSLAEKLAGKAIRRIYSSPVKRAVQTASILAESQGIEFEITKALQEWDVGIYEGTADPEGWKLHRQVMEDWLVHHRYDHKMPGGESFNEIQARFVPFIENLIQAGMGSEEETVLVGHGGLYGCMLPLIFRNVGEDFVFRYGFSNTGFALGETRPEGLVCLEWCGVQLED